MTNYLIQSIALLALAAFTASFHFKDRKVILLWQIVSICFWVVHYALLGAWAGAILIFANGLFTVLFLYKKQKAWLANVRVLYSSLVVMAIISIFTWKGIFDIFALLGVGAILISKWQDNTKRIKLIAILASVFWIAYDASAGSTGGALAEIIVIISILISLRKQNGKGSRVEP
jgi:hypothetical protein